MEPPQTWLSEPDRLLHILASCVVFFLYVVALTRISGKRTTANMNNFDWIITVGIGSLIASGILLRNVSMLDAMLAVAVLAGMQWLTTWAAMKSHRVARLVKPQPRLLVRDGKRLKASLQKERIAREELDAALRTSGLLTEANAAWVVIETNGQLSIIPRRDQAKGLSRDLLDEVAGPDSQRVPAE